MRGPYPRSSRYSARSSPEVTPPAVIRSPSSTTLAEIEHERRVGYAWYTDAPADLLRKDYPAWQLRLTQGTNAPAR